MPVALRTRLRTCREGYAESLHVPCSYWSSEPPPTQSVSELHVYAELKRQCQRMKPARLWQAQPAMYLAWCHRLAPSATG
eukprot:1156896-Pelagomonas_calceolata.AAC.12